MELNQISLLNKPRTNINVAVSIIPKTPDEMCASINALGEKKSFAAKAKGIKKRIKKIKKCNSKGREKSSNDRKEQTYLGIEAVRKMLKRLLFEKKIPREKLAQALNITPEELNAVLLRNQVISSLIPKINLPLIKLYCETFNN